MDTDKVMGQTLVKHAHRQGDRTKTYINMHTDKVMT